jgi:hypothetical protein
MVVVDATAPSDVKVKVLRVGGVAFEDRDIVEGISSIVQVSDEPRPHLTPILRGEIGRASFACGERDEVVWSEFQDKTTSPLFSPVLRLQEAFRVRCCRSRAGPSGGFVDSVVPGVVGVLYGLAITLKADALYGELWRETFVAL